VHLNFAQDKEKDREMPKSRLPLLKKHGVSISMDGRGRALDNAFIERLWRGRMYDRCSRIDGDLELQKRGIQNENRSNGSDSVDNVFKKSADTA
jgi:transposase InsO family protein